MAGEIQGNYQVNLQIQPSGIKAPGKLQSSDINIGRLLNGINNVQLEPKKEIVSNEKYTYQGNEGRLVKYDDGSIMFEAKKQVDGKVVPYQYTFKDEKALGKNQPSSQVLDPASFNERKTINYEYHRNGKIKNTETRKGVANILVQQEQFDKNGKIENRKVYDKNGKLLNDVKYTHNKDNSVDAKVYDKDNKLQYTSHTQCKPDGKTAISSETRYPDGALRSEAKYYDNGKIQASTNYFEDGKVKDKTEYWDNGVIKEQEQYDETGKVTKKISAEIDGNFGESRQVGEGDCYLMATINSIRELDNGQQMLNNLVKIETNENGEKVYKVTLPGAQVVAEGLRTDNRVDPNKMHITGEYTFTESEMQEILKQAGKQYSLGDGDVILLEAAFEKYRNEVDQTLEDNPKFKEETKRKLGIGGAQTGHDKQNILAGGYSEDPTFMLTGRISELYSILKDNPPFGLSYEDLQAGNVTVLPNENNRGVIEKSAISEIDGNVKKSKQELNEMLDNVMNDGKDGHIDNVAVASFVMIKANGDNGGHALTLKSVTEDTVVMINPWHPDKEITMSREDFIKSVGHLNVADTSKLPLTVADVQANPNNPTPGGALASVTNNMQANNVQVQNHTTTNTGQAQQTQQANQNNQTSYGVQRGDSLWKIAKKHLGEGATATQIANYINEIMKANPSLKWNKNHTSVLIRTGDNIILP